VQTICFAVDKLLDRKITSAEINIPISFSKSTLPQHPPHYKGPQLSPRDLPYKITKQTKTVIDAESLKHV